MTVDYFSLGACKEVTGSKHFLDIDGHTLQVDCGMFQGRREEAYQKNQQFSDNQKSVDAILLTHGHFDHCGALPIQVKKGFKGVIYSTPATRDIANIIMLDSAYIQQKDYEYLQEKSQKYPQRGIMAYQPFYDSLDVIKTLNHFMTVNYRHSFSPLPGIEVEFYDAGHILGSASLIVTSANGLRIGFSGDLGRRNLPILKDPEHLRDLDYLILEGTYGDRLHQSVGFARNELKTIILNTIKRRGKIIIPAFAIERTQELIYILHLLVKENKIPDIPIFIDSPMAVNATSIFKIHPECFDDSTYQTFISENIDPFGFENIHYVSTVAESKEINQLNEPAIVISASGMAENGRILHHLKNNIENPVNTIIIVGFMAAHTLGRKLVEKHPEIKIFGKMYKVAADIKVLNAFSAHADYREIVRWVLRVGTKKLKKIFLVHGEEAALLNLQKLLIDAGISAVEISEEGHRHRL